MNSNLKINFDKDNLHHAYLIEGETAVILPSIFETLESFGLASNSPDFFHLEIDNFKINEALALKRISAEKSLEGAKRAFVICTNHISLDAQNTMLRLFEEPIANTHFFIICPDINIILKTLSSRFYVIQTKNSSKRREEVQEFIKLSPRKRMDFIKDILSNDEDSSKRTIALEFLNDLEEVLHDSGAKNISLLEQILKVRQYLRQSGSNPKMLLESVAISMPESML